MEQGLQKANHFCDINGKYLRQFAELLACIQVSMSSTLGTAHHLGLVSGSVQARVRNFSLNPQIIFLPRGIRPICVQADGVHPGQPLHIFLVFLRCCIQNNHLLSVIDQAEIRLIPQI